MDMQPRMNTAALSHDAYAGLLAVEKYLRQCGLEHNLVHMVKLRVSQLNGCAFCIDMHWKDARATGESEMRLYGLDAWEESPYYTDRERSAFAWAEALTNLHPGRVSDQAYDTVKSHFSEKEISDLTMAVVVINAWNRISIASRTVPGKYQPPKLAMH